MYVGLDVGGTFLKAARVDGAGAIAAQLSEPVRKETADGLFDQLEAAVRSLAGQDGLDDIAGIGVGLPGIVDRDTLKVTRAPNVPVLDGLSVGEEMTRRLGIPSFAENDANAAGLAEAWLGAGRGAENVLFVTLGTGVGAAVIISGRIWTGRSGYAGEIGHVQFEPDGVPCGCGSWGCVETVAGIGGWRRRAEAAVASRESALRGRDPDPAVIVEAAWEGDDVALEIVQGSARALGVGLAAALNLFNFERVVIGGGVAQAGLFLLERIMDETRKRTFPQVFADCTFRLAELGGNAGVVGAAGVALLALQDRET